MRSDPQRKSRAQEKRTARLYGGQRQPGSGSGWARKGDVKTQIVLIENKRTDAKQITLKAVDLDKIWREGWAEGKIPALSLEISGRSWVMLPEADLLELIGADVLHSQGRVAT